MYTSILVPLDGSPLGERALAQAVPIAEQHGARIVLLHVLEPINPLLMGGGVPVRDSALDLTWREDAKKYLAKAAARLRKRTMAPVEAVSREGRIVPVIAAYATEAGIDLIVMCTHGRGGFERFWLGSVADGLGIAGSAIAGLRAFIDPGSATAAQAGTVLDQLATLTGSVRDGAAGGAGAIAQNLEILRVQDERAAAGEGFLYGMLPKADTTMVYAIEVAGLGQDRGPELPVRLGVGLGLLLLVGLLGSVVARRRGA
jgi:nucleotide-binding universal stress UspA family protein